MENAPKKQIYPKIIFTQVPAQIAKINNDAKRRAIKFAREEKPYISPSQQQKVADEMLQNAFAAGLDIARHNMEWNVLDEFKPQDRLTIRVKLNEENYLTIARLTKLLAFNKNTIITEAIWCATGSMFSTFQR